MERWSPNAEGLCDHCSDSTRIGIDRRTYERVPQLKWKFKKVSNVKAKENAQFWGAVDAANAVDLHVDMEYPGADSGRSRHHGIYLDMVCMAGSEWLRECVKTLAVEKLRNPSHIVIPQHRATAPVAALFGEIFPAVEISYAIDGRLSEATKQALTTLSERDTILVADDALVGGKTLVGLRQEIYGATLRDKPPKVQACVLVARPSSRATLNRVERIYRDNTGVQFFAGQTIFLPASDEANCPWCAERRYLLRILPQLNEPARRTAEGRIEQLTGHLPTPFLLGGEALSEEMKTHNSFFGTLRHKAAFAAACSVVQELRTEMDVDAGSSVREILDLPMVIQCFFDSVFISAILRTCQLRELDFIGQHQAIAAEIESKCHDSNMAGLVAELGWAAVQHKLPIAPVVSLLQRFTEHESIVMLLELLRYAADETELVDVLPLE